MIEKILKCIYIDDLKLNYKEMLKKLKSSNIKLFNKSLDKLKNDGVIFKDKDGRFVKVRRKIFILEFMRVLEKDLDSYYLKRKTIFLYLELH